MKESKYKKELAEFDVEKAYKTEEVMGMLKSQLTLKHTHDLFSLVCFFYIKLC